MTVNLDHYVSSCVINKKFVKILSDNNIVPKSIVFDFVSKTKAQLKTEVRIKRRVITPLVMLSQAVKANQ